MPILASREARLMSHAELLEWLWVNQADECITTRVVVRFPIISLLLYNECTLQSIIRVFDYQAAGTIDSAQLIVSGVSLSEKSLKKGMSFLIQ